MGDLEDRLAKLSPAQRALFEQRRTGQGNAGFGDAVQEGTSPEPEALSYAQERFWLLEQLHPGEPAHLLAGRLEFEGPLDVEALEAALRLVLERHPPLRTCFVGSPHPRPSVLPTASWTLQEEDLSGHPVDEIPAAIRSRMDHLARPFDLAHDPPLRALLVRRSAERHELLTCAHHIAVDGLSLQNFGGELGLAYRHLVNGEDLDLPELPRSFAEHAQQERARGVSPIDVSELAAQFQDLDPASPPADHSSRAPGALAAARVTRSTRAGTLGRVRSMAAGRDATPFEALLSVLHAWLLRVGGSDDLVVGIPHSGREDPALSPLIGLFIQSLPLRTSGTGNPVFGELVDRTAKTVRAARSRTQVPFDVLVREIAPERQLDRNPLFRVMFNFVDFGTWRHDLGGVTMTYHPQARGALVDLTLFATVRANPQGDDELELAFEFDAGLYERTTVVRWLAQVDNLLQHALRMPGAQVWDLALLPNEETSAIRRFEKGPPVPGHLPTVSERLGEYARTRPDAVAVEDELGGWSFAELRDRVAALADRLGQLPREGDQPIAVCLPRDRWLPTALLACLEARVPWVPIDVEHPEAHRTTILANVGVRHVLCSSSTGRELPSQYEHVLVDDGKPARPDSPRAARNALRANRSDGLAYVIHTSGSTGQPKGVRVRRRGLDNLLCAAGGLGLDSESRLLAITTATFDISILELLGPIWVGGTVHICDRDTARDANALADRIESTRTNVMQATPATWRMLMAAGWQGGPSLHAWCGGEALPQDLAEFLLARCASLWNLYGPTETTIWSTAANYGNGPVTVGTPLQGNLVRVVANPSGERTPVGIPGEIWIGGAGVAEGYHDLPDESTTSFVDLNGARFYRTGDRGTWNPDGSLRHLGRTDGQVKVRGHRIELGAVESALRADPRVLEAAAALVGTPPEATLHAWVVPRDGETEDWQGVWASIYESQGADAECDLTGWTRSRDHEPFSAETMRAWRDGIVARILALRPANVLEVGCGTGLLLHALKDRVDRYVGVDSAEAVVTRLADQLQRSGHSHVSVRVGDATTLPSALLPTDPKFDTILINSVVQYLPGAEALMAVLSAAALHLAPGGRIFVGDLRNLDLLPAFHRELARAQGRSAVEEHVRQRVAEDPELCVRPELFDALAAEWDMTATVHPRTGVPDRELDVFRFDAVLHAAEAPGQPAAVVKWPVTLDRSLGARVPLEIRGIPDARWASEPAQGRGPGDLGPRDTGRAIDPVVIETWARELGHSVELRSNGLHQLTARIGADPGTPTTPHVAPFDAARFCNRPVPRVGLEVLRSMQDRVPLPMVPGRIHTVATLPTTTAGKVDRRRLAQNVSDAPVFAAPTGRGPEGPSETLVAECFVEVLDGVSAPSANAGFFDLGGHSLLATRLVALLADRSGIELPLRTVFEFPTVTGLARALQDARALGRRSDLVELPTGTQPRLSPAQERLWFLQELRPDDPAYNMAARIRLPRTLDRARFAEAVVQLVERHPLLRSSFPEDDHGRPRVRIHAPAAVRLADERDGSFASRPFRLRSEVPIRCGLWRGDGGGAWTLELCVHHIASDGWSMSLALRELLALYRDERLAPVRATPWDYAAWLHDGADSEGTHLAFWQQALAGTPQTLALHDHGDTGGGRPSFEGVTSQSAWSEEESQIVRRAARAAGTTLFPWLLTVFEMVLAKVTGQAAFAVGTAVAQRPHLASEDVVGLCTNTVPLPAAIAADRPFADLVARNHELVLQAHEHRDASLAAIVELLAPTRDLASSPLFQVTFDLLNQPALLPSGSDHGHEWSIAPVFSGAAKFDLSLRVHDEDALRLEWEGRQDRFEASMLATFSGLLRQTALAAATDPQTVLAQLPFESESTRRERCSWQQGAPEPPYRSVVCRILDRARANPEAVALQCPQQEAQQGPHQRAIKSWTFDQLAGRARTLAAGLAKRGVGTGDRVVLALPRSFELVAATLAVWLRGAAFVPVDPNDPAVRRQTIIDGVDAALVWDSQTQLAPEHGEVAPPHEPPAPDAVAYVLHTSGTTGTPKGVVLCHDGLANYVAFAADTYCRSATGRGSVFHGSLSFDLTLTSVFAPLVAGQPVTVLPPDAAVLELARALTEAAAPLAFLKVTPSHLRLLNAHQGGPPVHATSTLVLGGEPVRRADLEPWHAAGVQVINEYGPTEATVGCTFAVLARDQVGPPPVGRPLPGLEITVRDAEGMVLPPGVIGEICVTGVAVAEGYLGRPDETTAAFDLDPTGRSRYRTGDLGYWRGDGQLMCSGRADGQRKVRGHRIEPEGIGISLGAIEGVDDVVCQVRPLGSTLVICAWYVGAQDPARLAEEAARVLPAWSVPQRWQRVPTIPTDAAGKRAPRLLPTPDETVLQAPVQTPGAADAADDTALVRAAFSAVLQLEEVPDDVPFFGLGGDSILALDLVHWLGLRSAKVELADVFTHQTVAAIARGVTSVGAERDATDGDGAPVLLPIQRWFLDRELPDPDRDLQAIRLDLPESTDPNSWLRAVRASSRAHPAFALRRVDGVLHRAPLASVHTATHDAGDTEHDVAAAVCASIDLARGPLLAAAVHRRGDGRTSMFVAAHHLAVDGVSWRVLLVEWEAAVRGHPPMVGDDAIAFARRFECARERGRWEPERGHWTRQDARPFVGNPGTEGEVDVATFVLSEDLSTGLLERTLRPHRMRAQEMIAGSLLHALSPHLGNPTRCTLDVEGHGRDLRDGLSCPSGVGWFTVLHPITVTTAAEASAYDCALATKEAWRATPGHGEGYGALGLLTPAPGGVLVNHLGTVGMRRPDASWEDLVVTPYWGPALRGSRNPLSHGVELVTFVKDGQLHGTLRRDPARCPASARQLIEGLQESMAAAAEQARKTPAGWTPGDFPEVGVSADELARVLTLCPRLEDLFPATPTQVGMLLHQKAHPDTCAYFEQLGIVLRGQADEKALRQAFRALIARHALLRACAPMVGHGFAFAVSSPDGIALPWAEHRVAGDVDAVAQSLRELATGQRAELFDLEHAPLLRIDLVIATGHHGLLLSYHHALLDGWSMPMLLAELRECFTAAQAGRSHSLGGAPRFGDYARALWARDTTVDEAFWDQELEGLDGLLPLPFLDPAPAAASTPHAELEHTLPMATVGAALEVARDLGVTPSSLVQALWALCIATPTGSGTEALFGLTVSGRTGDSTTAIGPFLNTVLARIPVPAEASLDSWLRDVQKRAGRRVAHERFPLPEAQRLAGGSVHEPAFESLLVFENYPTDPAAESAQGFVVEDVFGFERTGYPVTMVVIPGEPWVLRLLFTPDRLPEARATALLARLESLLERIARNPNAAVGSLCALSKVEERVAERLSCQSALPAPPVLETLTDVVAARGASLAWDGDIRCTLAELWARAGTLAAAMDGLPQGSVAVALPRGVEQITAVVACLRAGRTWVPIDGLSENATEIVEQVKPVVRIGHAKVLAGVPEIAVETTSGAEVASCGTDVPASSPDACVLFTSGTTGRARGVPLTCEALAHFCAEAARAFCFRPGDRVLQFAAPTFDATLEEGLAALAAGATLVPRPDPLGSIPAFLEFIQSRGITVLDLPTALWHVLVDALDGASIDLLQDVRLVIVGGEAVDPRRLATWFALAPAPTLRNTYGPTEATVVCAQTVLTEETPLHAIPIGALHPGVIGWVLDAEGRPVPQGHAGELHLGGPTVAAGYLGDPTASAARFRWHPHLGETLFATGDRVRWNEAEELVFLGRVDREWKIHGRRIAPEDLEARLRSYPGVRDAAVARRDPDGTPCGFCAVDPGASVTPADLRRHLRAAFPGPAVPTRYALLDELPRNRHGKVDVSCLPTPENMAQVGTAVGSSIEDPLVRDVCALATEVLGHRLAPDDDFFDAGGNSLKAVELVTAIQRQFGTELPFADLLGAPSPRGIAQALVGGSAPTDVATDLRLVDALTVAPDRHGCPRSVLLTGATGFLGTHILSALRRQGLKVTCLVRAEDVHKGAERLRVATQHYLGTALEIDGADVAVGSVEKPGFGLPPQQLAELTTATDVLIHNAASTSFLAPYGRLRDVNVCGTAHAIAVAAAAGATLHHVSTIGVIEPDLERGAPLDESASAFDLPQPAGGYPTSKWVGEQLVEQAKIAGLRAVIHRPGRLIPDPGRAWPDHDFVALFLADCIDTGAWPDLDLTPDLTPVSWVGNTIAASVVDATTPERLHLFEPEPLSARTLHAEMTEAGYPLTLVDGGAWLQDLARRATDPLHPLHIFLPALQGAPTPQGESAPGAVGIKTVRWLRDAGLAVPRRTPAEIRHQLQALVTGVSRR